MGALSRDYRRRSCIKVGPDFVLLVCEVSDVLDIAS